MVNMRSVDNLLCRILNWFAVIVLAAGVAAAQQAPPSRPQGQAKPPQTQAQKPSAQPEKQITPEEAQRLFSSVDEILRFASEDSRLPIRGTVKRELMSRPQFHDYLIKKIDEDPDTQRFRRTEAVLKKLSLVPRDFDLRAFLIRMLEEQVEGFYEPKTKTMYLLNWVQPELQQPVLAHELTHALQDQNFGLEKWSEITPEDAPDPKQKPVLKNDPYNIEPDEERAARQSVSEGQAMVVMLDYILAPGGHTVAEAPFMAEMFKQQTLQQTEESPILKSAPMYIRESLLFAYTFGLGFEQKLLAEGGKQLAFDAALRVPPKNTRQIMTPQAYVDREQLPPMPFPRIVPLVGKKYRSYDAGEVGQFDVYVMLKQFADEKLADELSDKWRGGLYWVVVRPGHQVVENKPVEPSDLAVFYLSRWASPDDATRFAQRYSSWLGKRYKQADRASVANAKRDFAQRVASNTRWSTEDGPVFVEPWGQMVLVMESFDDQTAAGIREIVLERPPAEVPRPKLSPEPAPKPLPMAPPAPHQTAMPALP
jgi:hypothetical protein